MPDPLCLYWTAVALGFALGAIASGIVFMIINGRMQEDYEAMLTEMQAKIDTAERDLVRYFSDRDGDGTL